MLSNRYIELSGVQIIHVYMKAIVEVRQAFFRKLILVYSRDTYMYNKHDAYTNLAVS